MKQPLTSFSDDRPSEWPHVTVAIPVRNGGARFREVCATLRDQDYPGFDVLCIDSGSSDGSLDIVREHGFRLHQISPENFGHGRTRNLAFELCDSPLVAFLTHDAVPVDAAWLRHLVTALQSAPDIAGAYGRHLPHLRTDPYVIRDLNAHFAARITPPVVRKRDFPRFDEDERLRQTCHFYSDNASIMRRDVWVTLPYPDVDFAEDQLWALAALHAGYAIAYAADAPVRHSHDFGPWESFQRSFDEARSFRRNFGYRMIRGPLHALRSILTQILRDLALGLRRGWIVTHPKRVLRRIGVDFMRPLGQYFGTLAAHSDGRTLSFLSRDNRLRKSP
ncbi:glycosyltransferase family 2 protein [Celeribacter sp. PS-C1]|uniref:glycosyltransferase family 2 protein n=1 Tax=Celeribacter sp. PS-C1 TaxID=2820813 RepID=UPI001C668AAB|nr:glycosyltransferase family 2 protein [Celeribacter sp. PS-C1]MBW6416187.1 glycosyltransferase [Celeribacter sp. PS-C1]